MKKIFLFPIFILTFSITGISQEYVEEKKAVNTTETASNSFIIRVQYIHKQGTIENRISADIGTDKNHPLSGKLISAQDRIIITIDGESKTYSNEVDLLNALSKMGWKVVSANLVTIINTQYMQYLIQN
jgi:hypothetical protein